MCDHEENREVPKSVWDYLKGTRETISVCRWVWRELTSAEARKWSKRMIVILIVVTTLDLISPFAVRYIFDGIASRQYEMLMFGFLAFVAVMFFEKICRYYYNRSMEMVIGTAMGDVDRRVTELFFEKSMGQHIQEGSSLSKANIEKGQGRVLSIIEMLLFQGVEVLAVCLISFILLFVLSPVAGLIMGSIIVIHLLVSIYLNKRMVEECTPIEKEMRHLNRHRVERWDKMERVKTCGKEVEEMDYMNSWWDRVLVQDRKFWLWFIKMIHTRGILNRMGLIAIMGYGSYLVWNEFWMIGMLYPLYTWSLRVSDNIHRVSQLERHLNWNIPSVKSMREALSIEPDVVVDSSAPRVCQKNPVRIALDGVTYSYPRGSVDKGDNDEKFSAPVIRNVSFEIAAGEKVALIGSSGAGKTTIMRLLLRYMDPDEGCIHINGFKLHEVNLESWMRMVGYIPQQPAVLDGTIRYNLTYGLSPEERKAVTDEKLWDLMRLLQIDFGERLVDGLDTAVGRNGVKLSGGQAQRLMIGAAAIKKPLFMVIDEATSSLDSTTEKKVYEGLIAEVLSDDVSALVIAHRLATVRNVCDKFVVLSDASTLGEGESQVEAVANSFEELYAKSPTFRQLADDQDLVIDCDYTWCVK